VWLQNSTSSWQHWGPPALLAKLTAAAAAALLLATPALADVSTLTAEEAVAAAKPLPAQQVNKGQIWLVFALGASALFGSAVLLENNEDWFPAISRANKALKSGAAAEEQQVGSSEQEQQVGSSEQEQQQYEQRLEVVKEERAEDARLEDAVLAGLQSAKSKVLPAEPPAAAAEVEADGAAPSVDAGSASGAGGEGPSAARPLFEISGEQIEASAQQQRAQVQQRSLQGASLEQLERELAERRAAAAAGSNDSNAE
jgi:hypothetical protein